MAAAPDAARRPRVIVTRPADDAASWVEALQSRGWQTLALPLIGIGEPSDPAVRANLQRVREQWASFDALMFVSSGAVQHFFAGLPATSSADKRATRFWAPGPGTARALKAVLARHGIAASCVDAPADDAAQFDSEHLWPVVNAQIHPGVRVLVVRGASPDADRPPQTAGSGREWLIERCREKGAQVEVCCAYERRAPQWTAAQQAQATEARGPDSLWLFSSSEALGHLRALLPGTDWSRARAVCTHDRIASAARETGFGWVMSCRPAMEDVLRGLESLQGVSS